MDVIINPKIAQEVNKCMYNYNDLNMLEKMKSHNPSPYYNNHLYPPPLSVPFLLQFEPQPPLQLHKNHHEN